MKTSVVEPLQSALEHIPTPNLSNIPVPAAVAERLPERLRPPKKRSRRPLMIVAIVVAALVAVALLKRRKSAQESVTSYNGSSPTRGSDASLVDVR
jgi:hypothetical protein